MIELGLKRKRANEMGVGKLKMWNADRGFGFIADDAGGPDMFLHINELKDCGNRSGQNQGWRSIDFRSHRHARWQDESQQCSYCLTSGRDRRLKFEASCQDADRWQPPVKPNPQTIPD